MKKIRFILITFTVTVISLIFCVSANAAIAGDLDGNGTPGVNDARTVLRLAIGLADDDIDATKLDMADYDYDAKISVKDARSILRVAIQLDPSEHYFAVDTESEQTIPATCTEKGVNYRVCTECDEDEGFLQPVPALGHDLSDIEIKEDNKCKDGLVICRCTRCDYYEEQVTPASHNWSAATCTAPKTCLDCGATSGNALGHSTRIGYCSVCGQYVDTLQSQADSIRTYLNGGIKKLNEAYAKVDEGATCGGFVNIITDTSTEAKKLYADAYNNFFYNAYVVCGDYPEFSEAKADIKNILDEISATMKEFPDDSSVYGNKDKYTAFLLKIDAHMNTITGTLMPELKTQTELWKK